MTYRIGSHEVAVVESSGAPGLRELARGVLVPVGLLWIAALSAGCDRTFGITPTELAPPDAYTCDCTCNGGGQSFDLSSDVCLPEDLNPAINPNRPPDFVPAATAVQADCHVASSRTSSRWHASASRAASAARAGPPRIWSEPSATASRTASERTSPPIAATSILRTATSRPPTSPATRRSVSRTHPRPSRLTPSPRRSSGAPPSARSTAA